MGKNYLHIELAFNLAQNGIAKNILAVLTTSNRKQVQFNCRTIYIQNRATNQRSGMILEVQIRTRVKVFIFQKFQGA